MGGAREGREVKFIISLRDTLCDSTYATKASSPVYTLIRRRHYTDVVSDNFETFQAFIDALPLTARSVLFGPFCELALAPVARQLKVRSHSKLFLLHVETLPRPNTYVHGHSHVSTSRWKILEMSHSHVCSSSTTSPLVTGGGLSFDYGLNKTNNDDEFYLLTRTGWDFKSVSKAGTVFSY